MQSSSDQYAEILVIKDYAHLIHPLEFTLEADICTIGRASICQIVVQHQLVSRIHAKIERDGPRYLLHDAKSANGTFVNGQRLAEPHLLQNDDLIGLGGPKPLIRFVDPDPTSRAAVPLDYDSRTMKFSLGQQVLDLAPTQFRLLLYLYQHAGEVCTRESCAIAIWGRDYDPGLDADALDDAISKLRIKLRQMNKTDRADKKEPELLQTRRGIGYILELSLLGS